MTREGPILIVDDEPGVRDLTARQLNDENYRTATAANARETLTLLAKQSFDLVIVDHNMPDVSGLELARSIQQKNHTCEIVIMTGLPDRHIIDECRKLGIIYFLFKPFHEAQLIFTAHAALYHARLKHAINADAAGGSSDSGVIGISKFCRYLRSEIQTFAGSNVPVLIIGETGTGKEVIAAEIHRHSQREKASFTPVNCAIFDTLANNELFGHAKGAFTGAAQSSKGFIGAADGGTLFLDEVGDLPMETQVKLLRFLDTGQYTSIGNPAGKSADVRLICATNKDLRAGIEDGWFRKDLYYRIAGFVIETEPLREHPEDIPSLVWHFLELIGNKLNRTCRISQHGIQAMSRHTWPGNVRELMQVLNVLTQRCRDREIAYADVIREIGPLEGITIDTYRDAKAKALREFDQEYFSQLLSIAQGSLKTVLELSGLHKKNFYTKIKEHGLSVKSFRRDAADKE